MKVFLLPALAFLPLMSPALAATVEDYMDAHNPARIYDWNTVDLLRSIKLGRVKIDARSHDELIAELEKMAHGVTDVCREAQNSVERGRMEEEILPP